MKALLFAGQGSQRTGMALDFYEHDERARAFFDRLENGDELRRVCALEDAELRKTHNTQRALITFETMMVDLLKDVDIDCTAGLSIGEYAALYQSGVLDLPSTLAIADYRGTIMEKISDPLDTAMMAFMTDNEKNVRKAIAEVNDDGVLEISNINTFGQIVVAGDREVMERLKEQLKKDGIKGVPLKVGGPFHTTYMAEAEEKLRQYFIKTPFHRPMKDLYLNLTGSKYSEGDLKEMMAKQVSHTVQFKSIIESMIRDGVDTFIEVGYGKVLSKFVKKIDRSVTTYAIASYSDYVEFRGKK